MVNQPIENLLVEAIRLREEDLNYVKSDSLLTEALIRSEEEGYEHGYLHALFNKFKNWKVLGRKKNSKQLIQLSKLYLHHALEFAESSKLSDEEKIHAVYLSAQAENELDNYQKAIDQYLVALEFYQNNPRSQSHLGDVKRHLGTTYLRNGELEKAKALLDEALDLIRLRDDDAPFIPVWETSCLLSLAEYYKEFDLNKAKELAEEAMLIAEKHSLHHRKEEISHFLSSL